MGFLSLGKSEILLALLLAVFVATELAAPLILQLVCTALLLVRLGLEIVSTNSPESEADAPRTSPFLAVLSSRAPPVF